MAWAAVLYGLSVHMKIYPLAFGLPIALTLRTSEEDKQGSAWKEFIGGFFNRRLMTFASVAGGVFVLLTALFYYT